MNRGDPSTQVQVDARLLWRAVLADLQQTVPPAAFEWLRNTRLSDFAADVATVEVGDRVTAETLHRRFARDVERLAVGTGGSARDRLVQGRKWVNSRQGEGSAEDRHRPLDNGWDQQGAARNAARNRRDAGSSLAHDRPRQMALAPARGHGLNPKYVFRTYVVGSANRFTHAASVSVAEHPGESSTRSSSTAAWVLARRICCTPSVTGRSNSLRFCTFRMSRRKSSRMISSPRSGSSELTIFALDTEKPTS